jgi:hypothetical protein
MGLDSIKVVLGKVERKCKRITRIPCLAMFWGITRFYSLASELYYTHTMSYNVVMDICCSIH